MYIALPQAQCLTNAQLRASALSINQAAVADANNSISGTDTLKSPGYKFEGTATSTLGVAAIQVSLFADKNCTIKVEQSPEGTNWDLIDTYHYLASGTFGVTVQAISSYVRVVVTSNAETTGAFRLQTVLCPIAEPLPRSLDENGNLKIANPVDSYGFGVENTPMGETRSVIPYRLIGATFEGTTLDTNFWTSSTATGASIAQSASQVLMTTTTASGSSVSLYSVRRARYVGGTSMRYRAVVQAAAGTANNVRRWGIGWGSTAMPTVTDGAWFMLNGTTFQLQVLKAGGTPTSITSFNGHQGATYDPGTNAVTYEIYWTNSKVYFIAGGDILHTYSASAATWANTMNFHVFADSVNSGTATSVTLAMRVATIYRLGNVQTSPIYKNVTGVNSAQILKYGPGTLHRIIIGTTQQGKTVTVYDNVTGTTNPISVITTPSSGAAADTFEFSCPFFNGLNITPNDTGFNLTVIYE